MFASSLSALTDSMDTPTRTAAAASTADFTVDNVEKVSRTGHHTLHALCIHFSHAHIMISPGLLNPVHKAYLGIISKLKMHKKTRGFVHHFYSDPLHCTEEVI